MEISIQLIFPGPQPFYTLYSIRSSVFYTSLTSLSLPLSVLFTYHLLMRRFSGGTARRPRVFLSGITTQFRDERALPLNGKISSHRTFSRLPNPPLSFCLLSAPLPSHPLFSPLLLRVLFFKSNE